MYRKLEKGESVRNLCVCFIVDSSTVDDIKNQCERLLKFCAESDTIKCISKFMTRYGARLVDLNKLVYE